MAKLNTNPQTIVALLEQVLTACKEAYNGIDELNGVLCDVDDINLETSLEGVVNVSDEQFEDLVGGIEDLNEFYRHLPTSHDLDTVITTCNAVINAIKAGVAGGNEA